MSYPTLRQILQKFETEKACAGTLKRVYWPGGLSCRKCHHDRFYFFAATTRNFRDVCQCVNCAHRFSIKSRTVFKDSHLPLTDWWLVMYLLDCTRMRISAKAIQRMLGVSYETAWSMRDRLRRAVEKDKDLLGKLIQVVAVDQPDVSRGR